MNLTRKAHQTIDAHYGDKTIRIAIDATCGNGNDSLFLARRAAQLFCFDIQAAAIRNTREQLQSTELNTTDTKVTYIQDSHCNLQKHCDQHKGKIDVVMFNLGFLPKSGDLTIATKTSSTIAAIQQAMQCLAKPGLISILCYRGHAGGAQEYQAILELVHSIDQHKWHWQKFDSSTANESTPILLILKRK